MTVEEFDKLPMPGVPPWLSAELRKVLESDLSDEQKLKKVDFLKACSQFDNWRKNETGEGT